MFFTTIDSPLGPLLASAQADGLTGLWFVGQKYFPKQAEQWQEDGTLPVFGLLRRWLEVYFAGERDFPDIPLKPQGSDFRQEVWRLLLEIPYGETTTYGQLAKKVAEHRGLTSMSSQAVGGAVGHNPISLIIPCHRVVGSTGSLTGYAGGLWRKERLLALEQGRLSLYGLEKEGQ